MDEAAIDYVPPQFTPTPNNMAEQLARTALKSSDSQVIWFIVRKTFGFRKKMDRLPLVQISNGTGLDRRRAHEALKRLLARRIITVRNGRDRQAKSYGMNFNLSEWRLSYPSRTDGKKWPPKPSVRNGRDRLSATGGTALSAPGRTDLSAPSAPSKERKKYLKETLKERGPGAGNGHLNEAERKELLAMQTKMVLSNLYTTEELIALKSKSHSELTAIHREKLYETQKKGSHPES